MCCALPIVYHVIYCPHSVCLPGHATAYNNCVFKICENCTFNHVSQDIKLNVKWTAKQLRTQLFVF